MIIRNPERVTLKHVGIFGRALTRTRTMSGSGGEHVEMGSAIPLASLRDIRESLVIAERLASASLLTSPGARRRIAARNLEMGAGDEGAANGNYVPPKQLLLYLVRYIRTSTV